jgi:hypothetical protein
MEEMGKPLVLLQLNGVAESHGIIDQRKRLFCAAGAEEQASVAICYPSGWD